jgi:O-antigen ligase
MTSSRTYWVAAVAAAGLTGLVYRRVHRFWVLGATGAGLFAIATAAAFNIQFDTKAIGKVIRVESISNLTGRVQLWERAIEAFEAQPYLGYGFTAGATGLEGETGGGTVGAREGLSSRAMGRTTMHSGYVQSLLDSGVIGTSFYLAVIVLSMRSLYRYDRERRFPAEFAALLFLAVANMSEAAIYSASVFSSALFWILAVFALSLSGANRSPGNDRAKHAEHA